MVLLVSGRITHPDLCRNMSLSPITAGFDFSFNSDFKSAAVVVLKPHANLEHADQHGALLDYCRNHWRSWYEFADFRRLGLERGEIILVFGVIRTETWALAAFSEHHTSIGANLSLKADVFVEAGASLHGAWDEGSSVEHRSGPQEQLRQDFDQTLFLFHYRVKPRLIPLVAPKIIRGGAGDEELDPGDEDTDEAIGESVQVLDDQDVEIEVKPQRIPV
jgi:hypothetical protein